VYTLFDEQCGERDSSDQGEHISEIGRHAVSLYNKSTLTISSSWHDGAPDYGA
jgi:hypothetical protein